MPEVKTLFGTMHFIVTWEHTQKTLLAIQPMHATATNPSPHRLHQMDPVHNINIAKCGVWWCDLCAPERIG